MVQLDIVSGQATGVQLGADGKMRVFLLGDDGREADYDFPSAEVGVREGHRVVIVRASDADTQPASIVLLNVSTGERDEYREAFAHFTERAPAIGPKWTAALIAAGMAAAFFFYFMLGPRMGAFGALFWAVFTGFVLYWPLWGLSWTFFIFFFQCCGERRHLPMRAARHASEGAWIRAPRAQTSEQAIEGGNDGGTG